jgi:hypothetical protein
MTMDCIMGSLILSFQQLRGLINGCFKAETKVPQDILRVEGPNRGVNIHAKTSILSCLGVAFNSTSMTMDCIMGSFPSSNLEG